MKVEAHRSSRVDISDKVNYAWQEIDSEIGYLHAPNDIVLVDLFSYLANDAELAATCLHALDSDREGMLRALRIRAEVEAARFQLAARPGEDVELAIDDKIFTRRLDEVHGDTGPTEFLHGVCAALVSDSKRALASLLELGTEERLRRGGLVTGAVRGRVEYALAFRALATDDAESARAWIARAREELKQEKKTITRQAAVQSLFVPELALVEACIAGEPTAFNHALANALEGHKAFWTRASNRSLAPCDDPSGWIAFEPLGLACLAHRRGIPVDVDSDYIPAWLAGSNASRAR